MFSKKNSPNPIALLTATLIAIIALTHIRTVYAAALNTLSDAQSSLKISTLSDHTFQFITPTGIAAGQGISITLPSGYATGTLAVANFDVATTTAASCTSFVDGPVVASSSGFGTSWGVSQATSTIYVYAGSNNFVTAGKCIQIRIGSNAISQASGTSQITNPSSPGAYAISIAGFGDNGTITQNIITDDTVAMTGTVNQSISFSISTTTIYFGTLAVGSARFASSTNTSGDTIETIAHSITVSTNAPSGFNLSIKGQTLTSQQNASNTISAIGASAASSTLGTEQFGIRATSTGGTGVTIDPTYAFTTSYGYDATATTSASFAIGTNATNPVTFGLRYLANIAGLTEAGTYVASIVYVATANF